MEEKLLLSSSASWVTCPPALLMHYNGRGFDIKVDPSKLAPGLHYAEVVGCSSTAPWMGPLFRVPVTLVKPLQVGCCCLRAAEWLRCWACAADVTTVGQ